MKKNEPKGLAALDDLLQKNPKFLSFPEDCRQLQEAFTRRGFKVSLVTIEGLHSLWSEEVYEAGWLLFNDADSRVDTLIKWIEKRNG